MPARFIATLTPSATFLTISGRPISSGRICSLIEEPTDNRGSSLGASPLRATVAKIAACGESTPSVPPDQSTGI